MDQYEPDHTIKTPDFSWAASLLLAHMLCYAGMIAAAIAGGAMWVYLIILLPFYLAFLGGGLGVISHKLRDWHMACLPPHDTPNGLTPAEAEVATLRKGLQWAILMVVAAGLGFMLSMQEGVVIMMVPLLFSLCASWVTMVLAIPHRRVSRTEALKQDALWGRRTGAKARQVRHHHKVQTLKRAAMFLIPLGVIYSILNFALPDSYGVDLLGKLAMLGVVVIAVWPNSRLPRGTSSATSGMESRFRMPRRRF
ncbi:hypothetical protein [Pseudooctadecabacter sp.]|uniref:hypothetical protein n=1 Tax=Pseudooctadecabacter sp. TaxID=1966338 RepID=UPI0035C81645